MIYDSHYKYLSGKWRKRHAQLQKELWAKHGNSLNWLSNNYRQLVAGSLGGLMLLSSSGINSSSFQSLANAQKPAVPIIEKPKIDKKVFLISDLSKVLPSEVKSLTTEEEQKLSEILTRSFGFKVVPEILGKRLNRSYGLIGAEQHLSRFPGDTMNSHFDPPAGGEDDAGAYWSSGMAPGLGAWGYFANSSNSLTDLDKMREKYYIAVQTFLAPDFYNRVAEYRDFFKYRKMLLVNPQNGKSIVADIGDAGPAEWTGKHLGGSPEVMKYLERVDGAEKGPVIYFFIDDQDDKIPLGPINPI